MGSAERLSEIVHNFSGKRIAVIGDLMLDVYIWGAATRISPEAPVPIVRVNNQNACLGGAANVMRNIVTLGGNTAAFGIIGDDHDGAEVKKMLTGYCIDEKSVYTDPCRRTTQKQRIIAGTQQLLRIDYENTDAIDESFRQKITADVLELIDQNLLDGIIFEDYGKGVLNETMLETVIAAAAPKKVFTALDPKPGHLKPVKGLNMIKPNRSEAFTMAGKFNSDVKVPVEHDIELHEVAAQLLEEWQPEYLLVSLAAQGMALFTKNSLMKVIPTRAREVFDVSGAGDTVISAFTLAMAAGASCVEAAEIANHAGGIVVGKVGTVTVSAAELVNSFSDCR
jgi:D-beta-D-heptose 7-phosphate kinase/D-beta-D-heptose 1-phosphate adenosyltransferase